MNMKETPSMTMNNRAGVGRRCLPMITGKRTINFLAAWLVLAAAFLTACGDDGNGGGNEDTLLTGLSGVVIFAALIWLVVRKLKQRS